MAAQVGEQRVGNPLLDRRVPSCAGAGMGFGDGDVGIETAA